MSEFVEFQLSFSTADMESQYFYGVVSASRRDITPAMPDGVYRVICGELFRWVDGVPPE